eukprot:4102016-Ditylum_brightwellii.AAC.1
MAIEETQLDEPSSTGLVDDNPRNKNKTTHTAAVTIQEDEDEDQTLDKEEDDNATAGFSAIFNNSWIWQSSQ